MEVSSQPTGIAQERDVYRTLAKFTKGSSYRAVWGEFVPTITLLLATWTIAATIVLPTALTGNWWWSVVWLLNCILLAIWIVRAFVLMHDAGHGALASTPLLNSVIAHVCSVFVFIPITHWGALHWHHHQSSGNIDKQNGLGDIYTLTVRKYHSLPPSGRWRYRAYRHWIQLLMVMPATWFILVHRLPLVHFPDTDIFRRPKLAELVNIAVLNIFYFVLAYLIVTNWAAASSWVATFTVASAMAGVVGILLFYIQHQFADTYYATDDEWSFFDSGVKGSTTLRLPHWLLEWAIGYINYHSVHHLRPTIPLYKLPAAHSALRQLGVQFQECRLQDIWHMFSCNLWDEDQKQMIDFNEAEIRRGKVASFD